MQALNTAYERVLMGCGLFAGTTLVVLAVLISCDVLLRNLGLFSSGALLELTEYALFITTFIAAPWVLWLGSHVRVDLVVSLVPAAAARIMEICADAVGVICSALLGWHGLRVTLVSFQRGDLIVKQLVIPEWTLMMFIPLSCVLLVIEFLRRIVMVYRTSPELYAIRRTGEGL